MKEGERCNIFVDFVATGNKLLPLSTFLFDIHQKRLACICQPFYFCAKKDMALIEDYCEVCGSPEVESVKLTEKSETIWKSICIKCEHETVVCVQVEKNALQKL